MINKESPKTSLIWKIIGISILASCFMVLANLFANGFDNILKRWFIYLGFFIVFFLVTFLSFLIAVWVVQHYGQKSNSD